MEKVFMYRGVRYGPGFATPSEELKQRFGLAPRVRQVQEPDQDPDSEDTETGADVEVTTDSVEDTEVENTDGLPEDFPAAERLEAEGFSSIEEVAEATDEELLELEGIGQGTLRKIREYLAEREIE